MKSVIINLQNNSKFKVFLFVTGMHNLRTFGLTKEEIRKDKIKNVTSFKNQDRNDGMDLILSKTIKGFKKYINKIEPDLIIVHGDRVESLACAIVGSINNIKVGHIEGGEISGTIDEIIRHSVSKLSNLHFVTNKIAKKRLIQMGEYQKNIYIIGSPDVDLILKKDLPNLSNVKKRYGINFLSYAIALFHPVTNELSNLKKETKIFVNTLLKSKLNYILIYPNNDTGTNIILNEYKKIKSKKIKIYPSIRFEYYLTLLKHSKFIIGNSSSGIMEAPYYGTPTLNLGNRQLNRAKLRSIIDIKIKENIILQNIKKYLKKKNKFRKNLFFGDGKSTERVIKLLENKTIWKTNNKKQFNDININ